MRTPPAFPTRLLIDFPNWLGDLAMALPAADRVIEANHGGETILHCRPSTARLLQFLYPQADIIVSHSKESAWKSAARIRRTVGPVDLGLSFRNALRAKSVLRLSCRWSGGSADQAGWLLLSHAVRSAGDRHQVHDADELLLHLGLDRADPEWKATLPASLRKEGVSHLRKKGCDGDAPLIALAPGVALGGSAKQWAPGKFGALAETLCALPCRAFIAIGPGEAMLAEEINRATSRSLPVLGEDLDAAGLASLLSAADLVLGNDSGPVHLAAILGVPVLSLFGPTDPARTAPLGFSSRVIRRELSCAPCHCRRCPEGHGRCLVDLEITSVLKVLEEMLEFGNRQEQAAEESRRDFRRASSGYIGVSAGSAQS